MTMNDTDANLGSTEPAFEWLGETDDKQANRREGNMIEE